MNKEETEKQIALLAQSFAEIHIGDGDCLGEDARELWHLLIKRYPCLFDEGTVKRGY